MKSKLKGKIRTLTLAGKSQHDIAAKLRIHRNSVFRAQRAMNLTAKRHGPRCPELLFCQETKALELLKSGLGTARVASRLGLREHAVRLVARKYSYKRVPTIDAKTHQKIIEEIVVRRNYACDIADKLNVSYKTVLRIAHQVLGVPRFRCSRTEPLSSDFPFQVRGKRHAL